MRIHNLLSSFNLFVLGTSLVFRPQKVLAYQEKPARVFCRVSSLASVPLRSGCLSICMPNLTTVKVSPTLSPVFSLEANGHSEKDLCKFKLEQFYCIFASENKTFNMQLCKSQMWYNLLMIADLVWEQSNMWSMISWLSSIILLLWRFFFLNKAKTKFNLVTVRHIFNSDVMS